MSFVTGPLINKVKRSITALFHKGNLLYYFLFMNVSHFISVVRDTVMSSCRSNEPQWSSSSSSSSSSSAAPGGLRLRTHRLRRICCLMMIINLYDYVLFPAEVAAETKQTRESLIRDNESFTSLLLVEWCNSVWTVRSDWKYHHIMNWEVRFDVFRGKV